MSNRDYLPDPQLDDSAMPVAALTVVSYLDSEGQARYAVATRGEAPMLTYLGMTLIAQREIAEWGSE